MSGSECPVCGCRAAVCWYDAGEQPLANWLGSSPLDKPLRAPLRVVRCEECSHSYLPEAVDRRVLYERYPYRSATSQTFRDHCDELAHIVCEVARWRVESVLDIGANDGTLLAAMGDVLCGKPHRLVGVDCAPPPPVGYGIGMIEGEFPAVDVGAAEYDVVFTLNTLNAVVNLRDFAAAVRRVLRRPGLWVIEVPYLGSLLADRAFDTIYHEHQHYWLAGPLRRLVEEQTGMLVHAVEWVPIHGGSLRLIAATDLAESPMLETWQELERVAGLTADSPMAYCNFEARIDALREQLTRFHEQSGGRWVMYGASAKSAMLLGKVGFGTEQMEYIVDDTPAKQGRFNPQGIPIVSAAELSRQPPDYVLCGAWNFKRELRRKLTAAGCTAPMLVPIPRLEMLR